MDTGRRATLRLLVGENDLPVVVIVDRYGAAASASATPDHRFPDEDFTHASFLLSVLGEGTFLEYLAFVERYAPDPVTADVARRARLDEARHVAFGVEHARHYLATYPDRAGELRSAVEHRAEYLADASGRSPHVEEALVVLAAGRITPGRIRDAVRAVRELHETMHRRRVGRLMQLGFPRPTAQGISEMHTPNFM